MATSAAQAAAARRFSQMIQRKMNSVVRTQVRKAIVEGIRDCARDIYRDADVHVPVGTPPSTLRGSRGHWQKPPKTPRGKNPQTAPEWRIQNYKPGKLRKSGGLRMSRSGVTITYGSPSVPYAARREFGIGDHVEQVPEYFRRIRRAAIRRTRVSKRPYRGRVIALQSVSGYYRFVRAEPGAFFLTNAVAHHLPNIGTYIQNALNRAATRMP